MRLELDLRFDATRGPKTDGEGERLDLNTIAVHARAPWKLWRLLRGTRYSEVSVIEGDLPLTAIQAAALVFSSAIPADHFTVGARRLRPTAFLVHALAKAAVAVPTELTRSAVLARNVSRSSRKPTVLPTRATALKTALYLRVDPTLNWMGLQVGGAATHTTGVIKGLLENGVDVQVLAAERPLGTERARFVQVPVRRTLQLVPGLAFADYTQELLRAAAELSGDFVYQRYRLGSDAGLRLAERLGVPLVLEFNGSEVWVEKNWASGEVRFGDTLAHLERRNLLDASLVVVVSDALRETAISEGARSERLLVNPNGVDIDELAPYRSRTASEWRSQMAMPDTPTVGFVGTFGLWHGVKLLPALVEAVPDARWVIIGDGQLFPEVEEELAKRGVSDRVLLTGLVERTRALELLACCDVCVSPHVPNPDGSPFFGSPTKLFEYMGLRKAIVASDLGQIGEILSNGTTAMLCTPGDVAEAADAVLRLLRDPHLRARLGDAAFELVAAEYTWTAHVRRILARLVSAPPANPIDSVGTVRA